MYSEDRGIALLSKAGASCFRSKNYYRTRSAATVRQREEHLWESSDYSLACSRFAVLYLQREPNYYMCDVGWFVNPRNLCNL
jgi:hypothetical protein